LDEYTVAIAEVTTKAKANVISDEESEAEKSRLQFLGGLYWDDDGLHMPGRNVFQSLYEGAKTKRLGPKFDSAVIEFSDRCPIEPYSSRYTDAERMFRDGHFHRTRVRFSGRSTVTSTRPRFSPWTIECEFAVRTDVIPPEQFLEVATVSGATKGIGDGRLKGYRMGRYAVEVV
jgi:hypothetical protein